MMSYFICCIVCLVMQFIAGDSGTGNDSSILLKSSHNIGVAMATQHGLVVPNVKNCCSKSVLDIAIDLQRLQSLAQQNKLPPEDVTGATITISNIGSIGGTIAGPIVNVPEVAIVALGKMKQTPVIVPNNNNSNTDFIGSDSSSSGGPGFSVSVRSVMNVSWSADHRVIDGNTIARFNNLWKAYLEDPITLLLNTK